METKNEQLELPEKQMNNSEKAVETLDKSYSEHYRAKRAIFLAAGFGSRLAPVTLNTPKPLIRVNGKRIIDSAIDACLNVGIEDIYIVRGYLGYQFDQLLEKYPMVKFIENKDYNVTNNISSIYAAREHLTNAYIIDADTLIYNPKVIKKHNYSSNFLGIKTGLTDDWVFKVRNGIITNEKKGGKGNCIYKVVGISYWNEEDGRRLSADIVDEFEKNKKKDLYWEFVPLIERKKNYKVFIRECNEQDVFEIDTFDELKRVDKTYEEQKEDC